MRHVCSKVLTFLFSLIAVGGDPRPALAEAPSPSGVTAVKQAEELFGKGNRLYTDGKWAEAEAAFREAWHLNPTFDVASNLGQTEFHLHKYRDAAEHFSFALRNWPLIGTPAVRQLIQSRLDASRAFIGALAIEVDVPHAEVFVDGQRVGVSPLDFEVFVTPGSHTVEGRRAGYEDAQQIVRAARGSKQRVKLSPVASAPPVPPASWPPDPPAPQADRGKSTRWLLPAASGVLAAAGIGAGIGLTFAVKSELNRVTELQKGLNKHSDCHGTPVSGMASTCADLGSAANGLDNLHRAEVASFVLGGAFTVVTAWLTVKAVSAPKRTGVLRVAPIVGAAERGVVVMGAW